MLTVVEPNLYLAHFFRKRMTPLVRLPAEWEPHKSTIMAWPLADEMWQDFLESVRHQHSELAAAVAADEPVHMVVANREARASAEKYLAHVKGIHFHDILVDDVWVRDTGPIFVHTENKLIATNWQFNGWGNRFAHDQDNLLPTKLAGVLGYEKKNLLHTVLEGGSIESNGQGLLLTSKPCNLNPNRMVSCQEEREAHFRKEIGSKSIIWLPYGLLGDHTDGHIDNLARFTQPKQVVATLSEPSCPQYHNLQQNFKVLKKAAHQYNFHLTALPHPPSILDPLGNILPRSYTNFYITNRSVIVPLFQEKTDKAALKILQQQFPDRLVKGLDSSFLVRGGGSFHCLTQPIPQGEIHCHN